MSIKFTIEASDPPILRIEGDAYSLRKISALLERAAENGGAVEVLRHLGEVSGEIRILRLQVAT